MICFVAILIILIVLKIVDLQKRISELESHDPLYSRKPVAGRLGKATNGDGPRIYVIPAVAPRRAS